MTLAADALLLGRITYEGMAQAWPTRGGNPFADHVNSITKYVVASQPVDTAAWDPTVVIAGPDLLDEVGRLKQADGGDIIIWGTGQLTDAPRRGRPARRVPDLHLPRHQGRRRAPVPPRQQRHRRTPRHQDLCHRRRRPRLPPHLGPLSPHRFTSVRGGRASICATRAAGDYRCWGLSTSGDLVF